jgi:hypothetical protein
VSEQVSPASYALTGKGIQSLNSPTSLLVTVTTFPIVYGAGKGNPANLYDIALLTPGDASGWYAAVPVSENPMHIPLPAGCTQLGYACIGGAALSVTEVTVAVPNFQKMPWDRNPHAAINSNQRAFGPGDDFPQTIAYTVPANRLFLLIWMEIVLEHSVEPTSPVTVVGYGYAAGAPLIQCDLRLAPTGQQAIDRFDGGGIVLTAGQTIAFAGHSYEATGQAIMFTNYAGTEFDV